MKILSVLYGPSPEFFILNQDISLKSYSKTGPLYRIFYATTGPIKLLSSFLNLHPFQRPWKKTLIKIPFFIHLKYNRPDNLQATYTPYLTPWWVDSPIKRWVFLKRGKARIDLRRENWKRNEWCRALQKKEKYLSVLIVSKRPLAYIRNVEKKKVLKIKRSDNC